ncbi:hypothetical protein [Bradyrhizobium uaiense]|uniref:hypothetical protein n=1 Tax=Bradyrhizobium uaiense TaxID=2594946 RepID=UPI0013D4B98C|nr:hypothetical protein [Bradyrhizobium uaiense]
MTIKPPVDSTRSRREELETRKQQRDDESMFVAKIFMTTFRDSSIHGTRLTSIRSFLDQLSVYEVQEAMELATTKMPWSRERAFRYFAGVCWTKIKRSSERATA